jgi:hypothetical protein
MDVPYDRVGSVWTTKYFVDVVGINQRARHLMLGACHWTDAPVDAQSLQTLLKHASSITPKRGEWTVDFIGFSAQGWDADAQEWASNLTLNGDSGKNWRTGSCRLMALEDVYADLKRWAPVEEY